MAARDPQNDQCADPVRGQQPTPGPWNLYIGEDGEALAVRRYVAGDNGGTVAKDIVSMGLPRNSGPTNARITRDEIDANARLIAAAPELLAVAKKYAADWEFMSDDDLTHHFADDMEGLGDILATRAAIAKAEGRS